VIITARGGRNQTLRGGCQQNAKTRVTKHCKYIGFFSFSLRFFCFMIRSPECFHRARLGSCSVGSNAKAGTCSACLFCSTFCLLCLMVEGIWFGGRKGKERRKEGRNFSSMSPSQGLQLFTSCSSVGPPQGHKSCQQTCSGVGSSLHGSAGPGRSLLQHGIPTGSELPSGIHLLQCGVPSTGYRRISTPLCTSMGCRGTTSLTMVFIMSCKGRLSALTFWAPPPPPPSSLTLVSAELFLSHRLTLLSNCCLATEFFSSLS